MLSLQNRLELLIRLGDYMRSEDEEWTDAKVRAELANPWFTQENIAMAAGNIATQFLVREKLEEWLSGYTMTAISRKIGIVMAGNIPLVGFHDFLCAFISGHQSHLKLSSKDEVLLKFLIQKLVSWEPQVAHFIHIGDMLKGCDAYIATGSNNTARYFEQYFGKYPHIIRRNRTSVAIFKGDETDEELALLGKDIFNFYGLGCRNVTQVCIPKGYDIDRLLKSLSAYDEMMMHHKYKNNYDYYLAIYLLNRVPYLTNGSLLMVENPLPFSAVSVLHYRYYDDIVPLVSELGQSTDIQCIAGNGFIPFGESQAPRLDDYADKIDVMEFLNGQLF